jgi:NAD(P)-dependent dehydrogenase (short-subunit alcohol dehydrogenase family)
MTFSGTDVQPAGGPRVLVAGGAGEVGEGSVRQLLRRGATVVVPSRSRARLDALAAARRAWPTRCATGRRSTGTRGARL